MGTRHHQTVINKIGEKKVSQYGQWDGYPSGQGTNILEFLRKADLNKYEEEVSKIQIANKEVYDEVNSFEKEVKKRKLPYNNEREELRANNQYYALSRDCGSDIHSLIYESKIKYVGHISQSEVDSWCEGFYTIDFQEGLFIVEYHGYSKKYKLNKLPTVKKFLNDFKTDDE